MKFQPDRGWSWIVLAAGTGVMFLCHLPMMCFSVIYAPIFDEFNFSATKIAWINATYAMVYNVFTIFIGPLCEAFGWRKVAMLGTATNALSILMSAYIPNPNILFFYVPILSGIGSTVSVAVTFFAISHYFDKRRGFAMGIHTLGVCSALLIGPPSSVYLTKEFGPKWSFLIMGALMLNGIPLASLYHPTEWHKSSYTISENPSELKPSIDCEEKPKHDIDQTISSKLLIVLKTMVTNFRYLKQRKVLHICFSIPFIFMGYVNFQMWIPFAIRNRGYTLETASLCMSAAAGTNILGRLFVAIFSDRNCFNRILCFKLHAVCLSISILLFGISSRLIFMVLLVCCWGFTIGAIMVMYPLVLIDVMGLDQLPIIYGLAALISAVILFGMGPVIGLVKDNSPNFGIPLGIIAALVSISALLWFRMPQSITYDQPDETKENSRYAKVANSYVSNLSLS